LSYNANPNVRGKDHCCNEKLSQELLLRSKYILHTQFFAFEYKNAMIVWWFSIFWYKL